MLLVSDYIYVYAWCSDKEKVFLYSIMLDIKICDMGFVL